MRFVGGSSFAHEQEPKKCPEPSCFHPHDMHMPAGAYGQGDPGGCKMLRRTAPDDLRVVPCTCPRTPDTFLAVAP